MSIFGNLDTTQVDDNPFYVKPATYWAVCTDAVVKQSEDGATQLVINWSIDEPDNEYHGKNQQEYYGLFPERGGIWENYTPDEKTATKWLKRRLRRGFDLSESEVDSVDCSMLIGKGAYLTLKESKGKEGTKNAGKTFVNIADALSKRLYEEEKGASDGVASTLGL
jgi:hypothetical protein